jgi:hypothetical protein
MEREFSRDSSELLRELVALSELTIEELKERWRSIYDGAPPGRCSKKLLVSASHTVCRNEQWVGSRRQCFTS